MNTKVIYTCLVGKYDNLSQPEVIYDDFDYICYSDCVTKPYIGIWEIRSIPFQNDDTTRLSRFVKINPHLVLADYDYSIYIDANIIITSNFLRERVFSLIENNIIWAQIEHTFIHSIYDDIIKCAQYARDKIKVLSAQYHFLKQEGYPAEFGLYENGVLFRKHNDTKVIQISEAWWHAYETLSRRDQHCLCYIFWKFDFKPNLLLPKGQNVRNHLGFYLKNHKISFSKKVLYKFKVYRNHLIVYLFKSKLFN